MVQYVNTEAFLAWYDEASSVDRGSEVELLNEVFRQYRETKKEEFTLPASQTKSGREEHYPYRFEHLNCCGADRIIITF